MLFAFDPKTHPPIEYLAGAVAGAKHAKEAQAFLAFLRGETARKALGRGGLRPALSARGYST